MAKAIFRAVVCAAVLWIIGAGVPSSADSMFFDGAFKPDHRNLSLDRKGGSAFGALDLFHCSNCDGRYDSRGYESIFGADLPVGDFDKFTFRPKDPDKTTPFHGNFSITGDPIDFGYFDSRNYHGPTSPIVGLIGDNNPRVGLTTVPAPEPSPFALLLVGLGLIGCAAVCRRKFSEA